MSDTPSSGPSNRSWPPHITVATIVQRPTSGPDSPDAIQFLMVEERDNGHTVVNQPAGHLEPGESLIEAAIRETLEETAWKVDLTGLTGVYQYYSAHNDTTYLRFCFMATAQQNTHGPLDADILQAIWMTRPEIAASRQRSPLVLQCIDDARQQRPTPLDRLHHLLPQRSPHA